MNLEKIQALKLRFGHYKRHAEIHPAMEKFTVGELLDILIYAEDLATGHHVDPRIGEE